jgi:autoinducer 2-degrading protein
VPYVVAVRWVAKPGEAGEVARALAELHEPSTAEAGVLEYRAHRDPDDENVFFMFEVYADADAYAAHVETPHFKEWGVGHAIPRLEERRREFYEPV